MLEDRVTRHPSWDRANPSVSARVLRYYDSDPENGLEIEVRGPPGSRPRQYDFLWMQPVVKVELYGVIRDLVKETSMEVCLPEEGNVSYKELLEQLAERYGSTFRERFFDSRGLRSHVKVYAGGRPVEDLDQPVPTAGEQPVRIIVFAAAGGG